MHHVIFHASQAPTASPAPSRSFLRSIWWGQKAWGWWSYEGLPKLARRSLEPKWVKTKDLGTADADFDPTWEEARRLSHTQLFHIQRCEIIAPPASPLSFFLLRTASIPACNYWKKLTCGVIRSFNLLQLGNYTELSNRVLNREFKSRNFSWVFEVSSVFSPLCWSKPPRLLLQNPCRFSQTETTKPRWTNLG